jgi:hypothetical protein
MNLKNKISASISEEAMTNIQTGLAMINTNLPFLITLTPDDKRKILKMGNKSMAFVSKSFEFAKQNPGVVPKYLIIDEFSKDMDTYNKLFQVSSSVHQLLEKVDDTMVLSGSEAYGAALAFYNSIKTAITAGEAGLKNIYDELSARFPGRPAAKTAVTTTE